jgi:hypothetical protein
MGAMMIATFVALELTKAEALAKLERVTDEEIERQFADQDLNAEEGRETLKDDLDLIYDTDNPSQVSRLYYKGTWLLFTGGQSNGDEPTEYYGPMSRINQFSLTEKDPVT